MNERSFRVGPGGARPVHRLGKYTLTGVLGEGAMGIVYKGLDPHINRPVAIKTIHRPAVAVAARDASAAARFRNEAQAAGRLSHPHIVSVYEYGVDGDETFIVMEYVDGQPLTRYVRGGKHWPIADVLCAMVQLLEALHYAHEQGVLHRDIKPANIILNTAGRLKITDFGIARIDTIELTQKSSVVGSPGYMAPERYTGDAPGRGVDVFACGVLLYALLTGQSAFPGTMDEAMYKILYTEPVPPSKVTAQREVPELYDAIVAKAIAKKPQDRYASAWEFRDALVAAAGAPVAAVVSLASVQSWIDTDTDEVAVATAAPGSPDATRATAHSSAAPDTSAGGAHGPASTLPPSGWDAQSLDTLQGLLAAYVGPIAKVVVRRVARQSSDIPDLVERLASEQLSPADRKAFLARVATAFPECSVAEPSGFAASRHDSAYPGSDNEATLVAQAGGSTPLTPAMVDQARRILAHHIGPIAALMTRTAAARAHSREGFISLLVDMAADSIAPGELLPELAQISTGGHAPPA